MSAPGLYLHIPFCSAICPYCDFAVLTGGRQRRAAFVDSLLAEIALWRHEASAWETFDTATISSHESRQRRSLSSSTYFCPQPPTSP